MDRLWKRISNVVSNHRILAGNESSESDQIDLIHSFECSTRPQLKIASRLLISHVFAARSDAFAPDMSMCIRYVSDFRRHSGP